MTRPAPVTTRFGHDSTAEEVAAGIDLTGRTALITGATSGLGVETARVLSLAGAQVYLAVRDIKAGVAVAETIAARAARPPRVVPLDLSSPASITSLVEGWDGPLDILVNNAGVVLPKLDRTAAGWEMQFAVNHLGHLALAVGLLPHLAEAAGRHASARVVALSSTAHMRAPVDFDDPNFEHRAYDPQTAYAQSKTANSLFAVEATRRWSEHGVYANAVNPGGIRTGLQRGFTDAQKESLAAAEKAGAFTWKTVHQGAATTLVACVAPEFERVGGRYLDDCQEAYLAPEDATLVEHPHGVKPWAVDPDTATHLWDLSLGLLGLLARG